MTPQGNYTGPTLDWLLEEPIRYDIWTAGFVHGLAYGINQGRRQANQEWTDTTTFACRHSLKVTGGVTSLREREAHRYGGKPALTAPEIHRRAKESWGTDAHGRRRAG